MTSANPPATYRAELPDEPPPGTAVIDHHGIAWQRCRPNMFGRAMWHSTSRLDHLTGPLSWPNLLIERGPVTELHRPATPTP